MKSYSKLIKDIIFSGYYQRYFRRMMLGDMKKMIKLNPTLNTKRVDGEDEHIHKWSVLSKKISRIAYRIYSPFIGEKENIVPPDVGRPYIEPILNPSENVSFYNDKNSLNLFIPENYTPKVYFRSIGGKYMNGAYEPVMKQDFDSIFTELNKVVVKPSKSQGGAGVIFFKKNDQGNLISDKGDILTIDWLAKTYNSDYLIQEAFTQSDYLSQFNPTSVNTIRAITYRDVKTGEIHFLGAVLRMGVKGAKVDNASQGGSFIGINSNGVLKNVVSDEYGRQTSYFNDIDFKKMHFQIPNYEEVKQFAIYVSLRIPHMSLFAHDIVLDKDNKPKLIEVNTQSFSYYFLQLTSGPVFGEYTDDVIQYCINNRDKKSVKLIF